MKSATRRVLIAILAFLAVRPEIAFAHTVSIGYAFSGPGSVTLWYGSYHANATFNEANVQLIGPQFNQTVAYTLLSAVKPNGLNDGVNNFYSNTAGTMLVGTPQIVASTDGSGGAFNPNTQSILNWQGATFIGLRPGTYTFTYNPLALPTVEWHAINDVIRTNSFTLTLADVLGIPGFQFMGRNRNQRAVGAGLDNALNGGAYNQRFYDLASLSPDALAYALSQLSGEPATTAARVGFQMQGAFLSLMLDPFVISRGGMGGYGGDFGPASGQQGRPQSPADAAFPEREQQLDRSWYDHSWSLWGTAYGSYNKTAGNDAIGSHDTRIFGGGFASGYDFRPAADKVVGFAVAGATSSWRLSGGLGGGADEVFQAGGYGSYRFLDSAYVSGSVAYGWHRLSTARDVTIFGTDHLTGNFWGHSFGGRIESGYRIGVADAGVTPYSATQVQWFHAANYREVAPSGLNDFALDYAGRDSHTVRNELGIWVDRRLELRDDTGPVFLRGRIAWAHDSTSSPLIAANFPALPGSNFTVLGATPATNAALVSAGAEWKPYKGISLNTKFDGEFSGRASTYSGTTTLRYEW